MSCRSAPPPLAMLAAGAGWLFSAHPVAGAVGLLHIGLDRLMNNGVRYDHDFHVTHLGTLGSPDRGRGYVRTAVALSATAPTPLPPPAAPSKEAQGRLRVRRLLVITCR